MHGKEPKASSILQQVMKSSKSSLGLSVIVIVLVVIVVVVGLFIVISGAIGNSQITEGPFKLSPTGGTAKTSVTRTGKGPQAKPEILLVHCDAQQCCRDVRYLGT